jgi:hypothetical protein
VRTLDAWPGTVPDLGARGVCAFSPCAECPPEAHPARSWTFVSYGGSPLCLAHAMGRAESFLRETFETGLHLGDMPDTVLTPAPTPAVPFEGANDADLEWMGVGA